MSSHRSASNEKSPFGIGSLAILAVVWGLGITVLWIIIGWRAMRAHERLAESIRKLVEGSPEKSTQPPERPPTPSPAPREDEWESRVPSPPPMSDSAQALRSTQRRYQEFLAAEPESASLPPKERHERFRAWNEGRDPDAGLA
ncbi:MAG: hypothetical protein R3F11_24120 [Verrucomicrobiales bacterium]